MRALKRLQRKVTNLALLIIILWAAYQFFWARHLYTITAYCNCPICINIPEYYDGKFASGKKVYWGGVAADSSVPVGAKVELVPNSPLDFFDIYFLLKGRFNYRVEDRGGKIKGRHIDLYIPQSLGGHKKALAWGRRRMRIKINGRLAD